MSLPINNFVVTETIKVTGQLQFICTFIAEYTQHGMLVTIPQCNFDSGIPKILKVFYASVDWICLGIPKKCIVGYSLTSPIVQVLSFPSSNLLCMECDDVILRLAILVPPELNYSFKTLSWKVSVITPYLKQQSRKNMHISINTQGRIHSNQELQGSQNFYRSNRRCAGIPKWCIVRC